MYDGTAVDGPVGVRDFVLTYKDQYVSNVASNLLTYALGRGVEYDDMPTVRALVAKSSGDNYKLKTIIEAITATDVFRMNVAPGGANDKAKDGEDKGALPRNRAPLRPRPAVHHAPGG